MRMTFLWACNGVVTHPTWNFNRRELLGCVTESCTEAVEIVEVVTADHVTSTESLVPRFWYTGKHSVKEKDEEAFVDFPFLSERLRNDFPHLGFLRLFSSAYRWRPVERSARPWRAKVSPARKSYPERDGLCERSFYSLRMSTRWERADC